MPNFENTVDMRGNPIVNIPDIYDDTTDAITGGGSNAVNVRSLTTYVTDYVADQLALADLSGYATDAELDAEVTARGDADAALGGRINDVITDASTESAARVAEEARIEGLVTTEATTRGDADTALGGRLDTIEGTGGGSITAAVAAETARATAAETGLGTRVDDEGASRASGDTANSSAISAEVTRATAAEDALDTRVGDLEAIDNVTQAEFDTFDAANTTALDLKADLVNGLVPRGQLPSIALSTVTVVADEAARDALTGQDEGDVAVLTGGGGGTYIWDNDANAGAGGWVALSAAGNAATDAELTAAIVAARAEWQAADTALDARLDAIEAVDYATQAELDTAVTALDTADTTNATAITAEADRATAAELDLDDRLTQEIADRDAADNLIRTDFATADGLLNDSITAVSGDLAAEVSRSTGIDTDHETRITTLEGQDVFNQGTFDALEGRVDTAETDITALEDRATNIENSVTAETNARTTADNALDGRLDTIEGDATVVGSVANLVKVETDARTLADTALNDRVATETSDRTAADQTIQTDINTRALDSAVVHTANAETVTGVKTFTASPVVPTGATGTQAVNADQLAASITSSSYDDTALTDRVTAVEDDITTLNGTAATAGSVGNTADARITAQKGLPDGLASLGTDGKVPAIQLPALALTNVSVVADHPALLAITGMDEGDTVIVADDDGAGTRATYIYDGTDWIALSSPADVTEEELAAAVDTAISAERTARITGDTDLATRIDGLGAGAGLLRTGDVFDVQVVPDRTAITGDAVDIAGTYAGQGSITTVGTIATGTWHGTKIDAQYLDVPTDVARKLSAPIGDGTATTFTVPTTFAGLAVVQVYDNTTGEMVIPDISQVVGTITIVFGAHVPAAGEFTVVAHG